MDHLPPAPRGIKNGKKCANLTTIVGQRKYKTSKLWITKWSFGESFPKFDSTGCGD